MTRTKKVKKEKVAPKKKTGAVETGLADILFPVKVVDEKMESNSEYSKRIVGKINRKNFLLNQCSPRYELVPNKDIFPNIEDVLNGNRIAFTANYRHVDHVRFYADYIITDSRYAFSLAGTDKVQPMLRVQHSYNGLTKYRIMFGYFRIVCSNGLVIPVKEMKDYNLVIVGKHTESIKNSFEKLNAMLVNFSNNAKEITEKIVKKYELLGGRMVTNVQDRVKEVLNAAGVIAVDNKNFNTINDIVGKITTELKKPETRGFNGRVNDWLVYNAINQYINDDKRNIAVPEKRMETDSKVFEYMLQG